MKGSQVYNSLKLDAQSKDEAALLEVLAEHHLRLVAIESVTGRYEVVLVPKVSQPE
jgi:hypothetical protein